MALATNDLYYRLGGSLEVGNVWANKDQIDWHDLDKAGSLLVIADTLLGPFSSDMAVPAALTRIIST